MPQYCILKIILEQYELLHLKKKCMIHCSENLPEPHCRCVIINSELIC